MILQAIGAADKNDPLFPDCRLDIGICGLAVELSLDSGEKLTLLLGDAKALEGLLDVIGHILPVPFRLLSLGEVVADVLKHDILQILGRPVSRHRLLEKLAVSLLAEGPHPIGISLHIADVVDGRLGQADACVIGVVHFIAEIAGRAVDVDSGLGLGTHDGS